MGESIRIEDVILLEDNPNSYKCFSPKVLEIGTFNISKQADICLDIEMKEVGEQGFIEIPLWLAGKIGL